MSVWVVDDSRLIRSMLSSLLTQAGIEDIRTAESGEVLVEALQDEATREGVQLVLLDMMMPGMDGIDTLRHVRSYPELIDIPVIIVTGRGEKEDLEAAFQAGASDFLTKPAEAVEFTARVKGALRLSELLIQRRNKEKSLQDSHARLEVMSLTDPLTGIANRRRLDQTLHQLWLGPSQQVSLVMIDIDHFKRYNDALGHPQGDVCLQTVANVLGQTVRDHPFRGQNPLVARYGGEEFAVLLPEVGAEQALMVAEDLRRGIEEAALPHPASDHSDHVTISVGLHSVFTGETTPQQLVDQADRALYEAKKTGRNRVVQADVRHSAEVEMLEALDPVRFDHWKHVLIVDDSPIARSLVAQVFLQEGGEVTEAASTEQALQHLPDISKFDLVVLDMHLKEGSGLEVLQRIREVNDKVVVVIFSGKSTKSIMEAFRLGADAYLAKGDYDLQGKDIPTFKVALNHAREHRLGVLARHLLQQVNGDFFSIFTHDLKSPIAALSLAVDLALESTSLDEVTPLLEGAREAMKMLLTTLNQYHDFVRLEAGNIELTPQPTEIKFLIDHVIGQVQAQAEHRQQQVTFTHSPGVEQVEVLLDRKLFGAALQSTLISIMKHASDKGRIRLHLSTDAEHLHLSIEDDGTRIPTEELSQLFYNPRVAHKWHGSGASLPLLRAVLEAHRGRMWAEASETPGFTSRFVCELPLEATGA